MIIEIGIVAGDIWHYLDQNKEAKLSQIISGIDKPRELVLMSIGWLAREGHVVLEKIDNENDYRVTLRKNE